MSIQGSVIVDGLVLWWLLIADSRRCRSDCRLGNVLDNRLGNLLASMLCVWLRAGGGGLCNHAKWRRSHADAVVLTVSRRRLFC